MQKERDRRAGLNTAGFISGYRGSPLGGLDQQFWRAEKHLQGERHRLPAGPQRGPRRDRRLGLAAGGDARRGPLRRRLRHLVRQGAGRRPHRRRAPPRQFRRHVAAWRRHRADGRRPHLRKLHHRAPVGIRLRRRDDADPQSGRRAGDHRLRADGLGAVALRRRCGSASNASRTPSNRPASIDGSLERVRLVLPDIAMPPGGLNIRPGRHALEKEELLHRWKRPAALAFIRENGLDRIMMAGGRKPRLGIVSLGKSWLDTLQRARPARHRREARRRSRPPALQGRGAVAARAGGRQPLRRGAGDDPRRGGEALAGRDAGQGAALRARRRADGGRQEGRREPRAPAGLGRARRATRSPSSSAGASLRYADDSEIAARLKQLEHAQAVLATHRGRRRRARRISAPAARTTPRRIVPEGSRAYAGIGCHYMALWMDRGTEGFTQMGGEGANWIGEAPFSTRDHVFQNLGDGTYNHSGIAGDPRRGRGRRQHHLQDPLQRRRRHDRRAAGRGPPRRSTRSRGRWRPRARSASRSSPTIRTNIRAARSGRPGMTIHHRSELDAVQEELRDGQGLSAS